MILLGILLLADPQLAGTVSLYLSGSLAKFFFMVAHQIAHSFHSVHFLR